MGELEAAVMDVLWDQSGWLTPGEVHQALGWDRPLAYTTVLTILVRLWRKERLERQRDGRAHVYRALQSREETIASRMGELIGAATDRPTALVHFVDQLSPADRAQLRRLLQREQKR